jgi:site-specific DNA recombinase
MERKIKAVAIYVRKSRDNKESLEGQLASLIEYCVRLGWEYEVFSEEGSASSEDWNRPELQRMIKLVEKQHFDAILVTEQSRITRADEFPKFRNVLQEANCLFITTQTNSVYDYNKPEDEFVSDIMSAVNKQEIAFTKLRLKRGTVQSAKKGNWLGKKCATGYSYNRETKRLEPNEDAPIIRRMFEEYLNGLSTKDIAEKFTFENVTTSVDTVWTSSGISRMLNNISYAGHSLYGRTTQKKDKTTGKRVVKQASEDEHILVNNTHEPIIDQEMWDTVQHIKADRNSRPISLKLGKHKYSGLIRCGLCGAIHSFQTSRYKRKRIASCQTRNHSETLEKYEMCKNQGGNVAEFDEIFHKNLERYIAELEKYVDIINNSESKEFKSNTEDDIKVKERHIKKLQQDVKRVQQGFIMEIFSEKEAQEQIRHLKQQQEELEKQIEQLKEVKDTSTVDYLTTVLGRLKKFLNGSDDIPERELNDIIKDYVETILYLKNEDTGNQMQLTVVWKEVV